MHENEELSNDEFSNFTFVQILLIVSLFTKNLWIFKVNIFSEMVSE